MADTTSALPSQLEPVVDRYRRWSPIWYPWIKKILETVRTQAQSVFEITERVDEIDGKWSLDITEGGKVRGSITLDASQVLSVIALLSDRVTISRPDGTGEKVIFGIGTVNGASTVVLNGDMYVDGFLQARHLAATSVSAYFASFGTMEAGLVRSADGKSFWNLNTGEFVIGAP